MSIKHEWLALKRPWHSWRLPEALNTMVQTGALPSDHAGPMLLAASDRSPAAVRRILELRPGTTVTRYMLITAAWLRECFSMLLAAASPELRAACWAPGGWGVDALERCVAAPPGELRSYMRWSVPNNYRGHAGAALVRLLVREQRPGAEGVTEAVAKMSREARGLLLAGVLSQARGRRQRLGLVRMILATGDVLVGDAVLCRAAALGAAGAELCDDLVRRADATRPELLRWAMFAGNLPLMRRVLLSHVQGPDAVCTPNHVMLAFNARTPAQFHVILELAPDVVACAAREDERALVAACRAGWHDVVDALLAVGATPTLDSLRAIVDPPRSGNHSRTPTRYWRISPRKGAAPPVPPNLRFPAEIIDGPARRLLEEAVAERREHSVDVLIALGVRVSTRCLITAMQRENAAAPPLRLMDAAEMGALTALGHTGVTPMRFALCEGGLDAALALASRGVPVRGPDVMELLLCPKWAADAKERTVVQLADAVTHADSAASGERALAVAVRLGMVEAAEALLLRAGAHVFAADLASAAASAGEPVRRLLRRVWRKELALGWARLAQRGVRVPDRGLELGRRLPRRALRIVVDFLAPIAAGGAGGGGAGGGGRVGGRQRKVGKNARRRRR